MSLIDNKRHGRMVDALRDCLQQSRDFSLLSNELSIFAYESVKSATKDLDHVRLLIAPSISQQDRLPTAACLVGSEEERSLRNRLLAPAIASAFASWIESKAEVRSVQAPVPHSMYLADGLEQRTGIQGSSTFTWYPRGDLR